MASSGLIAGSVSQNSSKFRSFLYWEELNTAKDKKDNNRSLVRIRPLVDTISSYDWNGTCSNMSLNINGTTNSYDSFNSNSDSGWTYSASDSPTGRTAENIMDGLSTNYWEAYVEHSTDGSKSCSLSCSFSLPSGGYGPGNVSVSGTITLDTIPRGSVLGAISNFTMDGAANTGVAFSVPVTKYVSSYYDVLEIKNGSTLIAQRNDYTTGNVTLLSSELTTAYNSMTTVNSATWTFELKTYADNSKATQIGSTSTGTAEASISSTGLNPTFSNFTIYDFDAVVRNVSIPLTNSAQKIVKGYSDLSVVVSVANKASGNKGASIVKYRLVVGEKQAEENYSANADVTIDITDISSNVFNLYAIDSRNNSVLVTKSPDDYFNYFPINIKTATTERSSNGVGQIVSLTFNGELWNYTFGNVPNNISATYRFKKTTDISWTTGTTNISPTLSVGSNNYSKTVNISGDKGVNGFDVNYAYNIEITVADKLSSYTFSLLLSKGSPAIAIHPDGVSFGKPYDESIGGKVQVNNSGVNIVGEIKMWATTTPPSGWKVCDGSAVSRTEYADLFGVIGITFGTGDGSTTFNLPNLKGKVAVGYNSDDATFDGIGKTGGHKDTQQHTHTQDAHSHSQNAHSHSVTYAGGGGIGLNSGSGGYRLSWNSSGDGSVNTNSQTPTINNTTATNQNYGTGNAGNLQPFAVLNYIIKV